MATTASPLPGSITWTDLTVPNATAIRDFYSAVVGWKSEALSMSTHDDYCMQQPSDGKTVAGICHARGEIAGLPPQWLIYITVPDLDASLRACATHGGAVIFGPREMGEGRFAVVRDPAGAVAALYQPIAAPAR